MSTDPSVLAEAEEADLVAGVGSFDVDCLQEIYRRHADHVLALAFRLADDREAAEALATEAFLYLWDHPEVVTARGISVRSFLLEQTRRAASTGVGVHLSDVAASDGLDEGSAAARPSLDDPSLDDAERRALGLAVGGAKYTEIAQVLGVHPDVVMGWLSSGLKKLAE